MDELQNDVQLHEKLQQLLELGKKEKKVASKDLIDALDSIDADEQQTDMIYNALEAAGIRAGRRKCGDRISVCEGQLDRPLAEFTDKAAGIRIRLAVPVSIS